MVNVVLERLARRFDWGEEIKVCTYIHAGSPWKLPLWFRPDPDCRGGGDDDLSAFMGIFWRVAKAGCCS